MALCVPQTLPETMPHDSEAQLMAAFQQRLGDEYVVMHSFPWLYPAREDIGSATREGEADFVILHRQKGVLVIEAKGGEITLKDRTWYRIVRGEFREIRDPAKQVRRAMRALRERIKAVCGGAINDKIRWATAVAFPHGVFKGEPPADLPRRAIITSDDLADIEIAVDRAFDAYGPPGAPLTGEEFGSLRRALAPEFSLYEPLKLDIDAAGKTLARLTRQQLQTLSSFSAPQAIIHGVAGSGKTMLALQRARRFAQDGRSVLLTCYNAELARWLNEEIADETFAPGSLTVRHFHGLAVDVLRQVNLEIDPTGDPAHYWDVVVPDQMAMVATTLYQDAAPYDALVVDEAQDFSANWWDALAYLTGLDASIPTWAFLDRDQSLFGKPVDPPLKGALVLNLDINCRNTRRIVGFAAQAAKITAEAAEMAPLGRPPRLVTAPSRQAIPGLVQAEIRRLLIDHRMSPSQIVLIAPQAWKNGVLAKWSKIADAPVTDSAAAWREGQGLLCTTARRFKGLEADVVVLYDPIGLGPLFTASDLYVAVTRARGHLLIVATASPFSQELQAAASSASMIGEALETA